MNPFFSRVGAVLLCVVAAGCTDKPLDVALNADQSARRALLETQMREADKTRASYHAMDNATLLARLAEQSAAKREPFNAPAYRELKTRSKIDAQALAALVSRDGDARALLPLLLLRKVDARAYAALSPELRARVLTDALQGSEHFNTWGLPNFYLEDAASALIDAGQSALPALEKLLADTRPAPVFGSKEYMIYKKYGFRVCDYALLFVKRIEGDDRFVLPVTAAERDRLIAERAPK